jgi:hypothetical protein
MDELKTEPTYFEQNINQLYSTWPYNAEKHTSELINSMELSPTWEAASCSSVQEFPNILWNSKVHYRVHKIPTFIHILSEIPSHSISLRYILILSNHLRLGHPNGLFPSGVDTKYSVSLPFVFCVSHPPWLHHSDYIWRRVRVIKSTIDHCGSRCKGWLGPPLTHTRVIKLLIM